MNRRKIVSLAATGCVLTALVVGASAAARQETASVGEPTGPYRAGAWVLPSGRLVTPAGRTWSTEALPLGIAVSPDGRYAVTTDDGQGTGLNAGYDSYCEPELPPGHICPYLQGRFFAGQVGNPATPTSDEALTLIDRSTGAAREVKTVPTSTTVGKPQFNFFYVGVTFSPDGRHLYASGGGNDSIYDFALSGSTPTLVKSLALPSNTTGLRAGPLDVPFPQYPVVGAVGGFTKSMAISRDGSELAVTHEFNNSLDLVDTATYAFHQVQLGLPTPGGSGVCDPYGVVLSATRPLAYIACQAAGVVEVVALGPDLTGAPAGIIPVGDHPTSLALTPDGSQLLVANSDDDTLSVVNTATHVVVDTVPLHAFPSEALGSTPNAVAIAPDGIRAYVTLAGDDAVAVLTRSATGWMVAGMITTGWYPSAVAVTPDGSHVLIASAKGLGSDDPSVAKLGLRPGAIPDTYHYDGNNMPGLVQDVPAPTGRQLLEGTKTVQDDIAFAMSSNSGRPAGSPIPAQPGGPTPIKHVIEIVRENRTFDQELGDLASIHADVNAQPAYTEFGEDITPNVHALLGMPRPGTSDPGFASADNFYSDGEASIQGHWWTAAANVNDYVEKSWPQYYSPRNHEYDPISVISQPHNCSIFQSAQARAVATGGAFTYRDYGELIGVVNPSVGGSPAPCGAIPDSALDPNAAQWQTNLEQDGRQQATEFLTDSGIGPDGQDHSSAQDFLRNFSYVIMGADHTGGLNWTETPRARVAQNDEGIGMIIHALSKSKYWSSTAVFVMEDDSQDGLDHIDGHRNLLFVISPYSKHTDPNDARPGYPSHQHLSQASVMKTIDLLMGFRYLSTYDQNATALYDLFQAKSSPTQLTGADLAPYNVQPEPADFSINETTASVKSALAASAVGRSLVAYSSSLDTSQMDAAGPGLEIVDWELLHPQLAIPEALETELAAWETRSANAGSGVAPDGG